MVTIPRCMSTQHPDNVTTPFFAESAELGGEDEVQEAYYAYSHLGCDEQMWDCEGKEVDNYVVKKLLTKYDSFFSEHRLGRGPLPDAAGSPTPPSRRRRPRSSSRRWRASPARLTPPVSSTTRTSPRSSRSSSP